MSQYWVFHCQVRVESWVITNAALVPEPLPTSPVPVHPVATYWVFSPSGSGEPPTVALMLVP